MSQISTPSYLMRVRADYDHHDVAGGRACGERVAPPRRTAWGMRQGHFQLARGALLYGFQPQNGEA